MKRKVKKLIWDDQSEVAVGQSGCLEIEPIDNCGDHWFVAHFKSGERVEYNSRFISTVVFGKYES